MKVGSCRICWSHIKKKNCWKRKDFLKKIRIRIQKCHGSVLYESWYVTLPILPSGLGFQTILTCGDALVSPKERDCPRRIREKYTEIQGKI